jgi:hypothetical protein
LLFGGFTLLVFCNAAESSAVRKTNPGCESRKRSVAGFLWNLLHGDISVINGYCPPLQQIVVIEAASSQGLAAVLIDFELLYHNTSG